MPGSDRASSASSTPGGVFQRAVDYIGVRVTEAIARIDPARVSRAVQMVQKAPQVFVYGAGRSGIIARAFAMRLVQTGVTAYVIGESVTPIVRKGDLVVIFSNRGESQSSLQTANIVRREGADLIVVTSRGNSKLSHAANILLELDFPEEKDRPTLSPLGTLFESGSLRLADGIIAELMQVRGETEESLRQRHAIMV
ncbi:MAG: SIS domain-containing protein [Euryarchaeota archaeon]|nr:SIS domain-containing protein [Euryarchaeota archaeon]MDE1836023.1 SIS domain-containing protein [Euryarchaeota archaeon]MDE1881883.1 SIS domain-containing protein [Euryarchaeota archaeon]MDE2046391.1 SIS domain-containing protein [Thermoplasmata archaeon]